MLRIYTFIQKYYEKSNFPFNFNINPPEYLPVAKVLNYFNQYLSSAYAVFQSRKVRQVFDKILIEIRMYERTLVSEGVDKEVALARQRSQQGVYSVYLQLYVTILLTPEQPGLLYRQRRKGRLHCCEEVVGLWMKHKLSLQARMFSIINKCFKN